jgi:hypothetical protein
VETVVPATRNVNILCGFDPGMLLKVPNTKLIYRGMHLTLVTTVYSILFYRVVQRTIEAKPSPAKDITGKNVMIYDHNMSY